MPATATSQAQQEVFADTRAYQQVQRAITALGNVYLNAFTDSREHALKAAQAGRAVFWSTASYHNAKASMLVDEANKTGLAMALAKGIPDDTHPSYAARTPYLLGTLIPLNIEARRQINSAWEAWDNEQRSIARARAKQPAPMFAE